MPPGPRHVDVTGLIPDAAARVERLSRRWGLAPDGRVTYGEWNLVLLMRRGGEPCVLRVCGPDTDIGDEVAALRTWDGNGAVRLLDADLDDRALLLERLDPDQSLATIPLTTAAVLAGHLIRRLAVPAPDGLPLLTEMARSAAEDMDIGQRRLGNPVPASILSSAVEAARQLAEDAGTDLVHGDLHYGNILAGTRQPWLAIDPKPFVGHPERSIAELLWTRIDEVADDAGIRALAATIVDAAGLDAARAHAWAIMRTTSYWLWGLENGLTEDPVRCRRLLDALIPGRIL